MFHTATLRIIGPEDQSPDTRKGDRLRAHGARLKCDVEVAIGQARHAQFTCRRTDRQDLRMGRGIAVLLHPVCGHRQHPSADRIDHHGAHRHLAAFGGGARGIERELHVSGRVHGGDGAPLPGKLQRRTGRA